MTRASLLNLLAHPAALTGPDVRALEELAQTFPYCQTAHLLLAKAAHDQGSMLAAQRLRRAATYAADRAHLRRLIELPAAVAANETVLVAHVPLATLVESTPFQSDPSAQDLADDTSTSAENSDSLEIISLEDKPDQVLYLAEALAKTDLLTPAVAVELPLEDELPAQAPPIRPPAKAQTARFEFGLAAEELGEIIAYQLPDADVDQPVQVVEISSPTTLHLPPFGGVADVHYAPSEGSRLGFCLVLAESSTLPPGATLPPTTEFFAPDGLLLAHLAVHQPPALPKPSSLDLINSFLQRAPVPSRRRVAPLPNAPEPEAQADLSVRSTRPEPDLASENLAKILVRQGKIDRAIAVYERLIVKHPEKIAYFAAQIESLRPSA